MDNTKLAVESLSMDLLRVALGYHRKSLAMAKRFTKEALKRKGEININEVEPYFGRILNKIPKALENKDIDQLAEDSLMYSVLCKNYAKKFL